MCLFKGRPKTRKSTAAASFPKPYFFDFDNRIAALHEHFKDRDDIEFDYYSANNFADFKSKLEDFQLSCPYDTIVLDSLTMFCQSAVQYFTGTRGRAGKMLGVYRVPDQEDFGGEAGALATTLEILKNLNQNFGKHVILNAHFITTTIRDMKSGTIKEYRQLYTGGKKLESIIEGYFNEVYVFEVENPIIVGDSPKYTATSQPSSIDSAGTALKIPPKIDITNGRLYDLIMKEIQPNVVNENTN